jgi:hypothetical protein
VTVKRLAALVVLAFAVAGCGTSRSSNEQPATTAPTSTNPTSPPSMATTTSTTASCQPLAGASLTPKKSPAQMNPVTRYLTDVSIEPQTCSDQVVFEFEDGHAPGYDVSYQPASAAKVEDASGNPVEIDGDAFLVVKLTSAMTAKIHGDQVTKTYTGSKRLAGKPPITEVVKTGDFESVVTWVIGLDQKRPFSVDTSAGTVSVTIDAS